MSERLTVANLKINGLEKKLELYDVKSVEEMTKQLTELNKENDNIKSNAAHHERYESMLIKE